MKNRRGIGLLELMLSLAIIGLLLITATRFYQSTRASQQVNDAVALLQTVMTAGENWLITYNNTFQAIFGDVSIKNMVDNGLLPEEFEGASVNPWGGGITVAPASADPVRTMQMILTNVPKKACEGLKDIMEKKNVHDQKCDNDQYEGVYP